MHLIRPKRRQRQKPQARWLWGSVRIWIWIRIRVWSVTIVWGPGSRVLGQQALFQFGLFCLERHSMWLLGCGSCWYEVQVIYQTSDDGQWRRGHSPHFLSSAMTCSDNGATKECRRLAISMGVGVRAVGVSICGHKSTSDCPKSDFQAKGQGYP